MSGPSPLLRPLAALALAVLAVPVLAQPTFPIEGYIGAVHPPASFDVDGRRFDVTSNTSFGLMAGLMGQESTSTASPLRQALRIGAYVQVAGISSSAFAPVKATVVLIHDDLNTKLSGSGVITRVISSDPAVFEADGYLVRIKPSTQLDFLGGISSLAEVSANTWLHFSGKWGKDGIVDAARVRFFPAKPTQFKAAKNIEIATVKTRPANAKDDSMTTAGKGAPANPADGAALEQDEQIKIGLGRWHTLPADQPLQQRVHRIGMALVPAYQRAMADDNPSKIHFRFFAVDNNKLHGADCLLDGAILVSTLTIARLGNDDQLAAIVADGIACNLQRQTARTIAAIRKELSIDIALDVAGAFVPGLGLAAIPGGFTSKEDEVMAEERLRIALALMRDAGFDPWQAPEAWRLLVPKKLPANPASLPYPDGRCYQIGILNIQYPTAAKAALGEKSAQPETLPAAQP